MVATLGVFLTFVFAVAFLAAVIVIFCHIKFGADPPPGIKTLIAISNEIYRAVLQFINPSAFLRRISKDGEDRTQAHINNQQNRFWN